MPRVVPPRHAVPVEFTWDTANVFESVTAWEAAIEQVLARLPEIAAFASTLATGPERVAGCLKLTSEMLLDAHRVYLYASMFHNADTTDQEATARYDRAIGFFSRVA